MVWLWQLLEMGLLWKFEGAKKDFRLQGEERNKSQIRMDYKNLWVSGDKSTVDLLMAQLLPLTPNIFSAIRNGQYSRFGATPTRRATEHFEPAEERHAEPSLINMNI